jgi:hypothetical protein
MTNPYRWVTLMEILRAFVGEFVQKAVRFDTSTHRLEEHDIWTDHQHRIMLTVQLEELAAMCETNELPGYKDKGGSRCYVF